MFPNGQLGVEVDEVGGRVERTRNHYMMESEKVMEKNKKKIGLKSEFYFD